jgi:hypothetical protein
MMHRSLLNQSRMLARTMAHAPRPAPRIAATRHMPPQGWSFSVALRFNSSVAPSSQGASDSSPISSHPKTTTLASGEEVESHALPAPPASTISLAPSEPLKIEPRKAITFNCGVEECGVRQTHEFTKRSYEKGIVIVQCPGCKNRWVYIFIHDIMELVYNVGLVLIVCFL